jgi:hypothetical protein
MRVQPAEIAAAALFLAEQENVMIIGYALNVDDCFNVTGFLYDQGPKHTHVNFYSLFSACRTCILRCASRRVVPRAATGFRASANPAKRAKRGRDSSVGKPAKTGFSRPS